MLYFSPSYSSRHVFYEKAGRLQRHTEPHSVTFSFATTNSIECQIVNILTFLVLWSLCSGTQSCFSRGLHFHLQGSLRNKHHAQQRLCLFNRTNPGTWRIILRRQSSHLRLWGCRRTWQNPLHLWRHMSTNHCPRQTLPGCTELPLRSHCGSDKYSM